MKKIIIMALSLILCLLPISISSSAQPADNHVKVGYFNYDGFTMPDGDGGIEGYGADYLEEIASYTGWTYEYVPGSVGECMERLERGEIDLAGGFQFAKERSERFNFSKYEIGTEYAMMLVPEDAQDICYEDYQSFNGMRIGFIKETIQIESMRQYAAERGFTYSSVYCDTVPELMEAIEEKEIDAIVIGSLQKNNDMKVVAKFIPLPYYFITSKEKPEFLETLNNAMDDIQTSDINFAIKLYNKYYGSSMAKQLAFTREEKEYIDRTPVLRIVCRDDWYPVDYYSREKKEKEGITTEILELLSRRCGISFEYSKASGEEDVLAMIQSGEADLLCAFPSDQAGQAKKYNMVLTKPYYEVPVLLSALPGKTMDSIESIALPGNVLSLYRHAMKLYPDKRYILMRNTAECVQAVEKGRVDAAFENAFVLEQYYKGKNSISPEPILSTRTVLPISIGIHEDADPALRTLLNKLITQISAEEINEVVLKETTVPMPFDLWRFIRTIALPVIGSVVVIILALALRSKKKIEKYAFTDTLTGYPNKTKFMMDAHKLLWSKDSAGYVLVGLDIDKFKLINSMHGFDMGNRILKEVAEILSKEMKTGEMFCREADDRFGLLLKAQPQQEVNHRLEKIIAAIFAIPEKFGNSFQYTVSCGVYELKKTDKDIYSASEWVNLARRDAKKHRQNWISWFGDSMRQKLIEEQEIENHMETALMRNEFQVFYQPKIDLESGKTAGAEALVRWCQKDGRMLYPGSFIPVFESNGFILKLDLYIFEQVCLHIQQWIRSGKDPYPISVNLSRVHLSEPNFYAKYIEVLRKYGIPSELIEIELTESMIFDNLSMMAEVIAAFKAAGLKISIDDFGAGYSSLNLLKELSFDFLKLDKEFLNQAAVTDQGKKVIRSIKYLADQLDMILLAEGVETGEQAEFLKEIGCDLAQGYYFSRPMSRENFEEYVGWRE